MEPTEQTDNRRAEFITRALACLIGGGIALYALNGQMAAIMFALSFLLLLCHVCDVNPFKLMWRMIRWSVGHKFDTRFTWGELNVHWPRWDFSLRLTDWNDDGVGVSDMLIVAFVVFSVYIHLPTRIIAKFPPKTGTNRMDRDVTFGFYTIDQQIVWRWHQGYYSWDIPFFSYNHFSTEVLSTDAKRTVYLELASDRSDWTIRHRAKEAAQCANCEVHSYTYTRRNGEVQHRMATCYIDRMTWTRKWAPFWKMVKTTIWVTFNDEIGEEVGTWKGGTTGCGWELRRGETIEQSLRRMEAERLFERGHRRREKKSTTRGFLARLFLP